ncbi:hypothetical protein WH95_01285 [Kiloniella litopenaei]|uniref:Solute-binding protein family 3/N-terminal domain-containing protein n=2 Tax=Kiloniella litopenaei TaxID=1549748 RepID=A0A0M2RA94_9PROT|nr:hypothetical protein WH95_01285 [Kiloniella litopenaei]
MKKLFALYTVSVLLLSFASSPSYAKNYKVCTVEIPGGMTEDKEGPQPLFNFYQEVIKDVSTKTGHTFELQFAPAQRCQNLFFKKEIDILWPFIIAEKKERITDQGYSFLPIYSMPIIMGGYHIFTRSDQPIINEVKDLDGKSVVSARGYGVPFEYEKSDTITKSITNDNALIPKMITGKRVDAGIIQTGWIPTLREQGLLEGLHHGEVIDFWGGSFVFHPDQEGVGLMNSFSNTILRLVTQGKYRDMMTGAPYYIPNY